MRRCLTVAIAAWLVAAAAAAQTTATGTLSVTIGTLAKVTISSNSISFPDADPTTVPQVAALPGPLTITAKARSTANAQVTLTVLATDDLRSGVTVLPASLLTWTATGSGFVGGTVSKSLAQPVATWSGSGVRLGTQSYSFTNLWTHPVGTYSLTLVYTLSAP